MTSPMQLSADLLSLPASQAALGIDVWHELHRRGEEASGTRPGAESMTVYDSLQDAL